MKVLALAALAATLYGGAASAQVLDSTLGFGGVTPDLGCTSGRSSASRFPRTTYNAATHERVMSNVSACTGGYIKAWDEVSDKHWNVDINANGAASGRDESGARWKYDAKARLFTLLDTGRTCKMSDLRHVCG